MPAGSFARSVSIGVLNGHDLGVHRQLAQTTSDQLRVLRAEIQNENGLMGHAEPETEREPSSRATNET